jgi:hypothetical protein
MLNKFEVAGLFSIAEIPWDSIHPIDNEYYGLPIPDSYKEFSDKNPWYLVMTKFGNIKIGPRKRVYEIDWSDTKVRKIISEDNVTKEDYYIHAWSLNKASEYLNALGKELNNDGLTKFSMGDFMEFGNKV